MNIDGDCVTVHLLQRQCMHVMLFCSHIPTLLFASCVWFATVITQLSSTSACHVVAALLSLNDVPAGLRIKCD